MSEENGAVNLSVKNNIGTIEFYHPKGNSLPGAILRKLADTITNAGNSEEIRVLVIKSRGDGAFCAGASFDELISIEDYNEGKKFFMGFAHVLNAMKTCPKLIIVRV
ncbi:MAG TPA: enoyl-CoA hydratase, partial [Balneolaceae bacterium]|nr:enoyl-CoA hydratase [Balneolaceae bacterium]